MESKTKLLGHPIHPMLIVFPLGLLATAVIFDVVALINKDPSWYGISFWLIAAGIIGGLCAAVFGIVSVSVAQSLDLGSFHLPWYLVSFSNCPEMPFHPMADA